MQQSCAVSLLDVPLSYHPFFRDYDVCTIFVVVFSPHFSFVYVFRTTYLPCIYICTVMKFISRDRGQKKSIYSATIVRNTFIVVVSLPQVLYIVLALNDEAA